MLYINANGGCAILIILNNYEFTFVLGKPLNCILKDKFSALVFKQDMSHPQRMDGVN